MEPKKDSMRLFVVGAGDLAHRAEQAGFAQPVPEEPRGVLGAAVGVHDRAVRLAPPARHVQGVHDQLGAQVVRDRPADHPAGEHVQHHSGVDPALAGAVLGDVGYPQPVRFVGAEPALHPVLPDRRGALRVPPAAAMDAGQAVVTHQPLHPAPAHDQMPAQRQVGVHPPGPIGPPRRGVHVDDHV
jgi:hypothetical protein